MFISQAPKYLQNHPQYTNSDYGYLRRKGWKNQEIKQRWDEEKAAGKEPCIHGMSRAAGLPDTTQILEKIAEDHLLIKTLATQRVGSLDFHEVAVWCVKDALEAAYKAGAQSAGAAA